MTTPNTIEDLARILQEQPTWAQALRALILSQELMDLPETFASFVKEQRAFGVSRTQPHPVRHDADNWPSRADHPKTLQRTRCKPPQPSHLRPLRQPLRARPDTASLRPGGGALPVAGQTAGI